MGHYPHFFPPANHPSASGNGNTRHHDNFPVYNKMSQELEKHRQEIQALTAKMDEIKSKLPDPNHLEVAFRLAQTNNRDFDQYPVYLQILTDCIATKQSDTEAIENLNASIMLLNEKGDDTIIYSVLKSLISLTGAKNTAKYYEWREGVDNNTAISRVFKAAYATQSFHVMRVCGKLAGNDIMHADQDAMINAIMLTLKQDEKLDGKFCQLTADMIQEFLIAHCYYFQNLPTRDMKIMVGVLEDQLSQLISLEDMQTLSAMHNKPTTHVYCDNPYTGQTTQYEISLKALVTLDNKKSAKEKGKNSYEIDYPPTNEQIASVDDVVARYTTAVQRPVTPR